MTTQVTPSKVVRTRHHPSINASTATNTYLLQAASAIEDLKMSSPVKKLDFGSADKENAPFNADAPAFEEIKIQKPIEKVAQDTYTPRADGAIVVNGITYYPEGAKKEELAVTVAPGIRPEEADEPLLQENPQRFVLFPIKYHEVSRVFHAFTRKVC
jgi:ribonucleoside-diphosphate reductase subunit M2